MSAPDRKRGGRNAPARAALLVLGTLLASSPPGTAQDLGRVELWGFLGGLGVEQELGTASNLFFTTTGRAQDVGFGRWLGFRASYRFSRFLAVEGGLARGDNAYTFTVEDNELGTVALGEQFEVTQRTLDANAVVQFPTEVGVVPYGTAGITRLEQDPASGSGLETVDELGYNLGAGVKYIFADPEWLGLRFDVRRHFVSEGIAFPGGADSPNVTELTFGVILHFLR